MTFERDALMENGRGCSLIKVVGEETHGVSKYESRSASAFTLDLIHNLTNALYAKQCILEIHTHIEK
jgi:hypothetical protein